MKKKWISTINFLFVFIFICCLSTGIGTVKGRDEYMFGEIREIAVDNEGQIFVLDTKKTLINVYDKNGLYKKTIGRHGQGPGELNYLHSIGYPIEWDRGEYNYFKSWLKWAAFKGDHIIFAFSENYELYIHDAKGELIQKIEKEYKPVRISEEELAYMRGVVRLSGNIKHIVPKHHDAFQRISVDDENRIFVQTWEKTKDGKGFFYDVFGPDGVCFARVPLRFNFGRFSLFLNPIVWKDGKVYAREEDEDGYQCVVRYSVHWE